jgi:exodeoxyribonuclease V alpha subunit
MSLLDALYRAGALNTLDHAFAQSLRRLGRRDTSNDLFGTDTPDTVLAAAALASQSVARGHAAFDPAQPSWLQDDAIAWPNAKAWRDALQGSQWVSEPQADEVAAGDRPLVWENGLLYLRRYREYERRLGVGLKRIAAARPQGDAVDGVASLFATLFPNARDGDRQARAAALALLQSLLLVTGGPGTGKTTTITRVLLLLIAQARGERAIAGCRRRRRHAVRCRAGRCQHVAPPARHDSRQPTLPP